MLVSSEDLVQHGIEFRGRVLLNGPVEQPPDEFSHVNPGALRLIPKTFSAVASKGMFKTMLGSLAPALALGESVIERLRVEGIPVVGGGVAELPGAYSCSRGTRSRYCSTDRDIEL